MIVYRDPPARPADPRALLGACLALARGLAARGPSHDEAVELLIEVGVLEAAVADALHPEADALPGPPLAALRRASLAAGRLLRLSWRGAPAGGELAAAAAAVAGALDEAAARGPLPALVEPRVPEGYAYYALYPETYLAAAERLAASPAAGVPGSVCVGVRSIGTSLSAAVAAGIEAAGHRVESLTLRPRGHPFARRPVLAAPLAGALRARAGEGWRFLVVDEGPGLSGSSLAGTAEALADLGVPEDRVVLFPSHLPDPGGLRSRAARERWPRLAKAHAAFEAAWLPRAPFPPGARDVAGGAWRAALGLPEADWPAVHPQHERRKYLAEDPAAGGGRRLLLHKFAGLGRRGRRARARAAALAEAGFAPPEAGLAGGFLAQVLVPGRPLGARDAADRELLATAGRYFGHLARRCALDAPARPGPLLEMVRANVAEGLGEDRLAGLRGAERHLRGLGEAPAVAIDGRVLRHEWLRAGDGYLKADAVDHHDDHFFPGPADIAWDVAAFGAEFALSDAALGDLAADVAARARDPGLSRRIPYYAVAYLAFRLGYAHLAAATLAGTPDGRRMAERAANYRVLLDVALRRLAVTAPSFTIR